MIHRSLKNPAHSRVRKKKKKGKKTFFVAKLFFNSPHLSYMTHSSHKGSHEIVLYFVRLCQRFLVLKRCGQGHSGTFIVIYIAR